jgi:hypothetical protein
MMAWFGGVPAHPPAAGPADIAAHQAAAAIDLDPAALDPVFYRWLTRPGAGIAAPGTDRLLLDERRRMGESAGAGQLGLDETSVLAGLSEPMQACFAKLGAEQR